jgi:hypothetical protein
MVRLRSIVHRCKIHRNALNFFYRPEVSGSVPGLLLFCTRANRHKDATLTEQSLVFGLQAYDASSSLTRRSTTAGSSLSCKPRVSAH